jgi:hypothetical protein
MLYTYKVRTQYTSGAQYIEAYMSDVTYQNMPHANCYYC